MASKTFKIGEYCKGGIITVKTTDKKITIIGKEWDYSQGSNKGSNQSNAKEFTRKEFMIDNTNVYREMSHFLYDLTTSYYTDEVLKWIESKDKIKRANFW